MRVQSTLIRIANVTGSRVPISPELSFDRHHGWYSVLVLGLLGGYLLFDRAFAHLHIPGTPIYLAEPVLAAGVVLAVNSVEGRRLLRFSTPIRALVGFMLWGLLLLLFNVFEHGLDTVQDSALWYYGLFAVVVGALVLTRPESIERFIPVYLGLLVAFAIIGWVRLSMTSKYGTWVPDTTVPWVSHRPGNISIHAAIGFAFVVLLAAPWLAERFNRSTAIALTVLPAGALLVLYVGAGTQNRGGLVAGFIVLAGLPIVRRASGQAVAVLAAGLLVLLGILYATGASVEMGSRDLSVRQLVDNIVSVGDDSGRSDIWSPVIDDVLTPERFLTGFGFGESFGDRYGFEFRDTIPVNQLRNVHNSHLNVLARMGIIGIGLWAAVWGLWYYHLVKARSRLLLVDSPRRAAYLGWALLAMTALLLNAFFDGTIESPQVGLWTWSIFGLGAAIALDTNMRTWQRRHSGSGDIVREGGGANPLDMSLRQMRKASKGRRGR